MGTIQCATTNDDDGCLAGGNGWGPPQGSGIFVTPGALVMWYGGEGM
jgi:hypothetical protein